MLSLLPRGTSSMDCRTVLPNISTLRVEEDRFRHGKTSAEPTLQNLVLAQCNGSRQPTSFS